MRRIIEPHPWNKRAGPTAWRRRGWLALVGGVHLLALVCWRTPERPLAAPVATHGLITYILAPARRPPPQPPLQPPTVARQAPERIQPRQTREVSTVPNTTPPTPETAPQPQAITQTAPPPDPFAPAVKPEDDLKQRALKSAFAADKQVRKESWTQRDRKIVNDTTALADAIGAAYVGGGSGAIGEMVMPDGSRVTKWRMPGGGVACIYKESNTFSGGRDPFKDAGRTSVRSCP